MKRGFTLIELLAVIVILAILALIATPIVLSIIDDSKESSTIRSAEGYLRAVEYEIAQAYVTANRITEGVFNVLSGGNICIDGYSNNECTGNILEIEYNNEGPVSGSITLEEAKITHYTLTYPSGITVVDGKVGDQKEVITELEPGLYDENDNLIMSWEELTTTQFEFDIDVDGQTEKIVSPLLKIESNGILYSVSSLASPSTEYLTGKLVIDNSVTSIGDNAFDGHTGLTNVIIPDSVISIYDGAFGMCSNLTSITIPDSVTSIGIGAFSNTGVTNINIPDSVTNISSYAFSGCSSLTNLTIGSGIEEIGEQAFSDCSNLSSVRIESGVVGYDAFSGCTVLSSIVIGNSVTMISSHAFNEIPLSVIYYKGTEEQWNSVTLEEDWDIGTPEDKQIIYNYKG